MFITHNRVRMHDTDMAGILYFAKQFRFVHDALEDFVADGHDLTFDKLFRNEQFVFVIVHAEADYLAPLRVGDQLKIEVRIEKIGETSFTVGYRIFHKDNPTAPVGTAQTVHVTLDASSRKKIPIPESFRTFLTKHLE